MIVQGTAQVLVGDNVQVLTEDQGTYVPLGELHQVTNPGKIDCVIIETQTGSYLEEDDIERIDKAILDQTPDLPP